ncbi:unnamed protein product [marine sediment metagenome]|uniref:Uncharacterized protein n=1 Tax=marine sediment metagenome TaxID=412755 RepID=X1C9W1_9ZZZZ
MAKQTKKSRKTILSGETKSARFIRVVTPRIVKAVKAIELIGNCAGSSYESTPEQLEQIFNKLGSTIQETQKKFSAKAAKDDSFAFTDG